MRKIGIFLGRLQPFHEGHKWLINMILRENQEAVFCIGSAQSIKPGDKKAEKNPLEIDERAERLRRFLAEKNAEKPWRIIAVADIDDDEAWPLYLAETIGIDKDSKATYTLYFGERISDSYERGLRDAGIGIKILRRKTFKHVTPDKHEYEFSNATEIRNLYRQLGIYDRI